MPVHFALGMLLLPKNGWHGRQDNIELPIMRSFSMHHMRGRRSSTPSSSIVVSNLLWQVALYCIVLTIPQGAYCWSKLLFLSSVDWLEVIWVGMRIWAFPPLIFHVIISPPSPLPHFASLRTSSLLQLPCIPTLSFCTTLSTVPSQCLSVPVRSA